MKPFFSIIVPVFNRSEELRELLISLTNQNYKDFELVVVEDGSSSKSDHLVEDFKSKMAIQYLSQDNTGPAIARNNGMAQSRGEYFLFIDSDCIAPEDWLENIHQYLNMNEVDAFGGNDLAAYDFNLMQKAISFAMTSFFTTGGIRGGKRLIGKFHPRSFNMGVSRAVYEDIGGFPVTSMHPGEDMVFTIEIIKRGYKTAFIENTGVYHKRRNTLKSFFKQVFKFGKTRYIISRVYPETAKWVFSMPSVMVVFALFLLVAGIFLSAWFFTPILAYAILIFLAAALPQNCSQLGFLSILTSAIQITAYGLGYFLSFLKVSLLKQDEYGVMKKGFYSLPANSKV